jgi:glutaredoxin
MTKKNIDHRSILHALILLGCSCLTFAQLQSTAWAQQARQSQPRLYFFTQAACPPCHKMKPAVDEIAKYIDVQIVDTQQQAQWADHFGVRETPTVVLAAGNQILGRHVGSLEYSELAKFCNDGLQRVEPQPANPEFRNSDSQTTSHQQTAPPSTGFRDSQVQNVSYESASPNVGNANSVKANAHRSTVRLKIDEQGATSYATGTVIHVHNNEALVVTCGHAFRDNQGKGRITGHSGFSDNQINELDGHLLYYDAGPSDVALVVVKPATGLVPSPIAQVSYKPGRGEAMFSYGCNHGEDPSIMNCTFLRLGRYLSDNRADQSSALRYDTTRRPVQGRSGGGLFNSNGELIGICTGAAVEDDEGIYGSIEVIYEGLQKAGLTQLFSNGNDTVVSTVQANDNRQSNREIATEMQPIGRDSDNRLNQISPAMNQTVPGEFEIVCNLRSKDARGQSQQIVVRNPSAELLKLLKEQGQTVNHVASNRDDREVIRAQSHQ